MVEDGVRLGVGVDVGVERNFCNSGERDRDVQKRRQRGLGSPQRAEQSLRGLGDLSASISVTMWLDYFSMFGHLQQ